MLSPLEWYEFSVQESASVLSAVAKLKAADADIGFNAELDYSIVDGDAAGAFSISTDEETQEAVIILQQVRPVASWRYHLLDCS